MSIRICCNKNMFHLDPASTFRLKYILFIAAFLQFLIFMAVESSAAPSYYLCLDLLLCRVSFHIPPFTVSTNLHCVDIPSPTQSLYPHRFLDGVLYNVSKSPWAMSLYWPCNEYQHFSSKNIYHIGCFACYGPHVTTIVLVWLWCCTPMHIPRSEMIAVESSIL